MFFLTRSGRATRRHDHTQRLLLAAQRTAAASVTGTGAVL